MITCERCQSLVEPTKTHVWQQRETVCETCFVGLGGRPSDPTPILAVPTPRASAYNPNVPWHRVGLGFLALVGCCIGLGLLVKGCEVVFETPSHFNGDDYHLIYDYLPGILNVLRAIAVLLFVSVTTVIALLAGIYSRLKRRTP